MSPDPRRDIPIGETLKGARQRLGIEIREAEERTKIRLRYLRALENEDWEVLPAAAYVRAFLRTYGQVLGLDGELLADEYRRRYEEPEAGLAAGESLLTERRRIGDRGPSRGPVIGGVVALVVALIVALGLIAGGGDDDDGNGDGSELAGEGQVREQDGQARGQGRRSRQRREAERRRRQREQRQPVPLRLTALTDVTVCVVAGGRDRALLDNQLLGAGTSEGGFGRERRWRVDVRGGVIRLRVGDAVERIPAREPVSLEADARGIRQVSGYLGPECP